MSAQIATPAATLDVRPPLSTDVYLKLSIMMFLQYAIWGAWLPLFYAYLTGYLGVAPIRAGWLFSIAAIGALLAPFIAGQIADRWFNTEKFLAISHLIGAVLVWILAGLQTWTALAIVGLLYSLVYAPTLALTNSLAFHHLPDRDRDFGKVRVWGTIGWIAVGIWVGQWLFRTYTPDPEPIKKEWLSRTTTPNAAVTPDWAKHSNNLKEMLLADTSISGKDATGKLIRDGVLQDLVKKGRAPNEEGVLNTVVHKAAAGVPVAKDALLKLGWESVKAEEAAMRVAANAARQELALRNGQNVPADLDEQVAATAARAVQSENQVRGMADALRLSAILGVLMGLYCFFLPRTPPSQGREPFAAKEALQEIFSRRALMVIFLISFPIACVHQFYFLQTAPFLNSPQIRVDAAFINNVFGVGGSGLMTIGQISEIVMLALVPLMAKRFSRKTFLVIGLLAYILRFAIFAYMPYPWAVIPALALHGLCFGFFFFICFMIVDELTTRDVRASAQGLFNLVLVGLGTIVGNLLTGYIGQLATRADGTVDFRLLFSVPLWITVVCFIALIVLYPNRSRIVQQEGLAAA